MPGETNTDKIRKLELDLATLDERVDNIRKNLEKQDVFVSKLDEQIRELGNRVSIVEHWVSAVEKRLDELLSRRWELWKLMLAAFLGSVLTLGSGFLSKWLERYVSNQPNQQGNVRVVPDARK
jgi:septal ring factor EnvC (AmiA/AmiB activator)